MSLLFFLIVITSPLPSQRLDPGFYLTQEKTANCERSIQVSSRKKDFLCLTPRPIIATDQFIDISGIVVDDAAGISYADLTITEDAARMLKALASSFRNSTMVLILNDRPAGILTYNESTFIRENQIRISASIVEGGMTEVHSELKAIVERNLSQ